MSKLWSVEFLLFVVYASLTSRKKAECPFYGLFPDTLFATSGHDMFVTNDYNKFNNRLEECPLLLSLENNVSGNKP